VSTPATSRCRSCALPTTRRDDPVARPPPLPGRETIAEHYFAAAYDKAARRAVALAAASGLIDLSEPED